MIPKQTIPDGTLCVIISAPPRFSHLMGSTVVVTFDVLHSVVSMAETYDIGNELVAKRTALMPIPPKEDDAEIRNTDVPTTEGVPS